LLQQLQGLLRPDALLVRHADLEAVNLRTGGSSDPFQPAACLVGCGIDPDSGALPALG